VGELEGVDSANPFGNSITDMGLGVVWPSQIRITHRLPKGNHESEPLQNKIIDSNWAGYDPLLSFVTLLRRRQFSE
jgi:hypothetical protein